ncbi:MAG: hypothetical protein WCP52_12180 [Bacteroidota bacterium]
MEKNIVIVSRLLIFLSAIVFIMLYFELSFYNRPASGDDLLYIEILKGKNMLEFVNGFYQHMSGRWASYSIFYSVVSFSVSFLAIHYYLFIYYCFTFGILLYAVNAILSIGISRLFDTTIDKKTSLIYSVLFIATLYFLTCNHIEVWWWFCASNHALQGMVFLMLGMALLLKEKKQFIHYILIAFSFAIVGGTYEVYLFITLLLFVLGFIYLMVKNREIVQVKKYNYLYGIAVAFLFLVISGIVSYSAPGNVNRLKTEIADYVQTVNPSNAFSFFAFDTTILFQKKYILGIGLSSLWLILGRNLSIKNTINIELAKKWIVIFLVILSVSILSMFIFQSYFLKGVIIPARGWTYSSLILTFLLCISFLTFGTYMKLASSYLQLFIRVIIPGVVLLALSLSLFKQYYYTRNFATEYDNLISLLVDRQNHGMKETVYVAPLPESGMLIQMDISDSSVTVPIKEILNLPFDIAVKK